MEIVDKFILDLEQPERTHQVSYNHYSIFELEDTTFTSWHKQCLSVTTLELVPHARNGNQLAFLTVYNKLAETKLIGIGRADQTGTFMHFVWLNHAMTPYDFLPYIETHDLVGIGPMVKYRDIPESEDLRESQVAAILRAIIEKSPEQESELLNIVGHELLEKAKNDVLILVPEKPTLPQYSSKLLLENAQLMRGMNMNPDVLLPFINYLTIGKNVILTGPPGTGKTTVAERAAHLAVEGSFSSGYLSTTATSDWSTFDTIGGYMPNQHGKLVFHEGVVLRAIRSNNWLLIDELNRADIDKAFGPMLTVLSGKGIELPYQSTPSSNNTLKIQIWDKLESGYDAETYTYFIGRNWRILATMNTFDKNTLYQLSYALMRRFAFVEIPIPERKYLRHAVLSANLSDSTKGLLRTLVENGKILISPAILRDIITYCLHATGVNVIVGIFGLLVPHLEGMDIPSLQDLYAQVKPYLREEEQEQLLLFMNDHFEFPIN